MRYGTNNNYCGQLPVNVEKVVYDLKMIKVARKYGIT